MSDTAMASSPIQRQTNGVDDHAQAADALRVSEMVVRRLIAQKTVKQIVKFAPWMIDRTALNRSAVPKEIRRVHEGGRAPFVVHSSQSG
jgi:hypothetical protein